MAFSPDGKCLASASGQGEITLWDVTSGQQALLLRHTLAAAFRVAFSPDGQRLASIGGGVQVWEAPPEVIPHPSSHLLNPGCSRALRVSRTAFRPSTGKLKPGNNAPSGPFVSGLVRTLSLVDPVRPEA